MRTANGRLKDEAFRFAGRSKKGHRVFNHVLQINVKSLTVQVDLMWYLQSQMIGYNQAPMEEHEKEGAIYILAIIGFIASILILVSLTHVFL